MTKPNEFDCYLNMAHNSTAKLTVCLEQLRMADKLAEAEHVNHKALCDLARDARLLADTVICNLVKYADGFGGPECTQLHEAVNTKQWQGMAEPERLGEV